MSFEVQQDLHARRLAVRAEHARGYLDPFPGVRVVRKLDHAAAAANGGLVLFDAHRQLGDPAAPALFCRRLRGLTANAAVDGGLVEFELWEAHPTEPPPDVPSTSPTHVHVDIWNGAELRSFRFAGVTNAAKSVQQFGPFTIFATDYFAGDDHLGRAALWIEPGQPKRLTFTPDGLPPITVYYDVEEEWRADLVLVGGAQGQYQADFTWTRGDQTVLTGTIRNLLHVDSGSRSVAVELADAAPSRPGAPAGLDGQSYYYYALFLDAQPGPDGPQYAAPAAVASALATGEFGEAERLYRQLPAIHRSYDEPDPAVQGQGQLRRFLQVFGGALDQARGNADGLRHRNDLFQVDTAALPRLARWIGWDVDRTSAGEVQRNDVLFASEIFARVGTAGSLKALIPRALDWSFTVREFVANVFFTNARPTREWDVWTGSSPDGEVFGQASAVVNPNPARLAGRPALVIGDFGLMWMFWHQLAAGGRREIWVRWPLQGFAPQRVAVFDGISDPQIADECPAVLVDGANLRLFWSSNRGGSWDIWTRTLPKNYQGGQINPIGAAERLTDHAADDRNPAAVIEPGGRLWLFWQSNRRGPCDIWARTRVDGVWSEPRRITTAAVADQMPAAALDQNGAVHLFWSAATRDGCKLYESVLGVDLQGEDQWSAPAEVPGPPGLACRDEAPCAVLLQNRLRLYWHSNRRGSWQIWTSEFLGGAWTDPVQVEQHINGAPHPNKHMVAAKEPAAVPWNLGLFTAWRSQHRAEAFASRTFNTADPAAIAALGTLTDWNHYTYDTGRELADWYATDTVGVHFTVPQDDPLVADKLQRVRDFIEPYRPATVRIVWFAGMDPVT
ncbi:phage tail protein domain-containing protein [Nannocystis exedens]|uniref:Phage tail protein domain-containing protein n=1 Tax=Nannocystis exedens TaxID=54 RepID=A0A1I2FVA0_9BACT|nr:hypothetical protein [Nannocystis exedens]PCC73772.1 hypothetical protein NAEX_06860 [Nannocystis exedens]SFF09285.1 phage tail protein domain-containing protein [Nannocystis exedens]